MWLTSNAEKRSEARATTRHKRFAATGFVVYSGPWVSNSAGIGCLHRLCDELNQRGYPSFTTGGGGRGAAHLDAPMVNVAQARTLCANGYIAVYPETISGNPLAAHTVVRWVLNRPGLLGGDKSYDDSELVFSYSDAYLPYIDNKVAGKLYMPTIDQSLFYCEDSDLSKRSLECFYVGKSQWKDGAVDPSRSFEITRDYPKKSQLGKLLRAARVLYCFDNSTILIYEALMCGCPVVIIPDGTQTRADFERLELGMQGVSWGKEEFKGGAVDVAALRSTYATMRERFGEQIGRMIELAESRLQIGMLSIGGEEALKEWRDDDDAWWPRAKRAAIRMNERAKMAECRLRWARKDCIAFLRREMFEPPHWRDNDGSYYCTDADLTKRNLECFYRGARWRAPRDFDERKVFEISPTTSTTQLGALFRASRRFYCYSPSSPLIRFAELCGCPTTIVGKGSSVVLPNLVSIRVWRRNHNPAKSSIQPT